MDFAVSRFDQAGAADFAVLMVLVTARQGASLSARQQAVLWRPTGPATGLLAPADGAFSAAVARTLRAAGGMNAAFTAAFQPIFKTAPLPAGPRTNGGSGAPDKRQAHD